MSGFEGSFLGANDKISLQAIMECKICWTPYNPEEGDDTRQVLPGTAFLDLPDDWKCPNCDAPKEQFLVAEDPGSDAVRQADSISEQTKILEADFVEIWHGKMRDVPLVNKALHIKAVGFRMYEGRPLGVLISPWFMNLVLLPGEGEDWRDLVTGDKEVIAFPSGEYEFLHNTREMVGGYKACSLFSVMGEFRTQAQAVEVAQSVMVALFDEDNRAETDRSREIRAAREAELDSIRSTTGEESSEERAPVSTVPEAPNRRQVISAGLAREV